MREVMNKTESGEPRYFDSRKYQVGEWYQSIRTDKWYIVTSVERGVAVDCYGDEDRGWFHTLRKPTAEELAERDWAQAEWEAKSSEERVNETLNSLAKRFPGLDWGDEPADRDTLGDTFNTFFG